MEWFLFSWPTLILLGLALRMSLRLTYGARGPEPGDPVYVFLNITGWVLIGLGSVPIALGGAVTFLGGILLVLGAVTVIEVVVQGRMAQRRSVCRMLALLVDRGAQLGSTVLMAGHTSRGIVGRAARKLFAAMNDGMPLPAAVARFPKALPLEASAYLAAGNSRAARLAALRELGRGDDSLLVTTWRECIDRVAYLTAVLAIMSAVLTFIMIKIVPEYNQIFDEFGLDLPVMTQLVVALSEFAVVYLAAPFVMLFFIIAIVAFVASICYLTDVPAFKWFSDWFFSGRQKGHVLRILAIATEHRQPLADVLGRIGGVFPSEPISRQVATAAVRVERGADWRDALRSAGLISGEEQSLLKTAEQVGNLPWALREIARRREKRLVYRFATALQVLYPLTILLVGSFVGFVCISLFVPIVQLIEGLSR